MPAKRECMLMTEVFVYPVQNIQTDRQQITADPRCKTFHPTGLDCLWAKETVPYGKKQGYKK